MNKKLPSSIVAMCDVVNGIHYLNYGKMMSHDYYSKQLSNDECDAVFSAALNKAPRELQLPMLFSAVYKPDAKIAEILTMLVTNIADFELQIAAYYQPSILIVTTRDTHLIHDETSAKLYSYFENGFETCAVVMIGEHTVIIPIQTNESNLQITLKAIQKIPGQALLMTLNESIDAYEQIKNVYSPYQQKMYIEELESFASLTTQDSKDLDALRELIDSFQAAVPSFTSI